MLVLRSCGLLDYYRIQLTRCIGALREADGFWRCDSVGWRGHGKGVGTWHAVASAAAWPGAVCPTTSSAFTGWHLEVDAFGELGSGVEFLLGYPQLVPEVSPIWTQACSFGCVGWTDLQNVLRVLHSFV